MAPPPPRQEWPGYCPEIRPRALHRGWNTICLVMTLLAQGFSTLFFHIGLLVGCMGVRLPGIRWRLGMPMRNRWTRLPILLTFVLLQHGVRRVYRAGHGCCAT